MLPFQRTCNFCYVWSMMFFCLLQPPPPPPPLLLDCFYHPVTTANFIFKEIFGFVLDKDCISWSLDPNEFSSEKDQRLKGRCKVISKDYCCYRLGQDRTIEKSSEGRSYVVLFFFSHFFLYRHLIPPFSVHRSYVVHSQGSLWEVTVSKSR